MCTNKAQLNAVLNGTSLVTLFTIVGYHGNRCKQGPCEISDYFNVLLGAIHIYFRTTIYRLEGEKAIYRYR